MRPAHSIRARLILGAALVLLAFLAFAGAGLLRAHEDSVRSARYAQLQTTVYLLLAGAELDEKGALVMPAEFPEPRLSLPGSGLYASVVNAGRREQWRSGSSVGKDLAFPAGGDTGQWRFEVVHQPHGGYLAATYAVRWTVGGLQAPLVVSAMEDIATLERESHAFARTLLMWLAGTGLVLLASQTLLLHWALSPLERVAKEVRRVESAQQEHIEGRYPAEIAALTENINALIRNERVRHTRYKEALSYLAHSLKTPLAVLRASADDTAALPRVVAEQVTRMDDIVQHQLARAAAGGGPLFTAPAAIAPLLERIRASLVKVYADKGLALSVDCPPELAWRLGEGDAFELLGNLMDNAAKWAAGQVRVRAWCGGSHLHLCVEDDGPGFSDTRDVLKLHVRGDERVPGHGVGLAVVHEIVQAQGGALSLARSSLGGAKVEVTLDA
jgi:two-component system sensor histidine kinase PhoQ